MQGVIDKPLEKLAKGETVHFRNKDWSVTCKDTYTESDAYRETQWTLEDEDGNERYLVRSEEVTAAETVIAWVFTSFVELYAIEYEKAPDTWERLAESDFPSAPPQRIRIQGVVCDRGGETSGMAEDDDGNNVRKITWDYYDAAGRKNIAIEIWKEPDKDYPEAYDGDIVESSAFTIVTRKPPPRPEIFLAWNRSAGGYLVMLLLLFFSGCPLDRFVAWTLPLFAVFGAFARRVPDWWLYISSAAIWIAAGTAFVIRAGLVTFWEAALYGTLCTLVIPRIVSEIRGEGHTKDYALTAVSGFFPVVWAYSFIVYFQYAPRPHTVVHFAVCALLPVASAGIAYAANIFVRRMYAGT